MLKSNYLNQSHSVDNKEVITTTINLDYYKYFIKKEKQRQHLLKKQQQQQEQKILKQKQLQQDKEKEQEHIPTITTTSVEITSSDSYNSENSSSNFIDNNTNFVNHNNNIANCFEINNNLFSESIPTTTTATPSLTTTTASAAAVEAAADCCPITLNPFFYCYYERKMIFSLFLMEIPHNIDTDIFLLKEYDRLKMLQEQQGPRHTEILLRKEDNVGGRKALKEKFVEIYEAFFNGEDPSANQPSFWEQLFLIKVNVPFLERCIILTSEDHLLALKPNINLIFTQCCTWLRNPDGIRVTHVLETLSVILKSIFRKKFNNFGFDVMNILCGIENADTIFKDLILDLQNLLKYQDQKVKVLAINLLSVLVTATEYINQNTLLQFFMVVDIYQGLVDAINDKELPQQQRIHALTILIYLSNFQKYEILNPYNRHIAGYTDDEKIKGIVELITKQLEDQNKFFANQFQDPNQSVMSRFGGYLSSWVYTPVVVQPCSASDVGSCLMMLYELFYQNETFIKLLIGGALTPANSTCPEIIKQFFVYCGYLAHDTAKDSKTLYSKLSLNTLVCMAEKRELEDYFHEVKTSSYIFIYSKKSLYPDPKELDKQPLSCYIVDVVNQFMKCNLKGKLPTDLYQKCANVIQRVVSYKKKTQSRLPIKWVETWTVLFSFLGSLNASEKAQHSELLPVGIDVINIFNLFVNYGDLFLPDPSDYDDLFYEIIRGGQIIESFSSLIEIEDPTGQLMNNLLNIKTIIQHFNSKIQQWTSDHQEVSLTTEQVIKLIKDNYVTLRLKLQENLDQYERYVESSKEANFYRQLVRYLVQDTKINNQNFKF